MYKLILFDTQLSKNLGFLNNDTYNDKIVSNLNIDLRYEKYIKLILKKITEEDITFILSLINQNSYKLINLNKEINISNFEIEFKTLNDNDYNFCNLSSSFELKFYSKNKCIELIEN